MDENKLSKKEISTIVRLPQEVHTAIKVKCAHNNQTLKSYVTRLILEDLKKEET